MGFQFRPEFGCLLRKREGGWRADNHTILVFNAEEEKERTEIFKGKDLASMDSFAAAISQYKRKIVLGKDFFMGKDIFPMSFLMN